jgi:hypothetical protein
MAERKKLLRWPMVYSATCGLSTAGAFSAIIWTVGSFTAPMTDVKDIHAKKIKMVGQKQRAAALTPQ